MKKYTEIVEAPFLGLFHLTIDEAAELMVMDMWAEGHICIETPDDWDGDERDPIITSLLSGDAEKFKANLIASINKGMLKPSVIMCDFNDQLISEDTYLDSEDIQDWLNERYYCAGYIWNNWLSDQRDIVGHLIDEIIYAREIISSGKKIPSTLHHRLGSVEFEGEDLDGEDLEEARLLASTELLLAYKGVVIENQKLKKELKNEKRSQKHNKADRPLTTRQRKTCLTIIAALCSSANIDPQARGASQRIKELTESLGVPVDDETIRTLLSEIPDALEVRLK